MPEHIKVVYNEIMVEFISIIISNPLTIFTATMSLLAAVGFLMFCGALPAIFWRMAILNTRHTRACR
jgi:hypothetical protein